MSYQKRIIKFCDLLDYKAPVLDIMLARVLSRSGSYLRQDINHALLPHKMELPQYVAMVILSVDDIAKPTTTSALGKLLYTTPTQTTRLVDKMETAGWITRLADKVDRRRTLLTLTPEGKSHLLNSAPSVHSAYKKLWSVYDEDEKKQLFTLLSKFFKEYESED